ncbi:hypothetical protein [Erwinia phage FBB1]|nr:hypothetical protein [Erwinia phage FBB1]
MAQNNLNHYSDLAKYKIFDPANTQWPGDVKDVQTALGLIGSWSRTDVGLPPTSETVAGISRVATQDEVNNGDSDNTIVTPKTLKVRLGNPQASETVLGLTKYATNDEAAALTINNKAIVPSSLAFVFNNVTATTARNGTVKLTSAAQAQAGTDETTATPPARVKEMIAKFAPVAPTYSAASETVMGLTKLATVGQTAGGTLREGFAVSPYSFSNTRATEVVVGTTRMANEAEGKALNDRSVALTPGVLAQMKGSTNSYGIVRLTNGYDSDSTAALASTAPVVYTSRRINGHYLDSDFNITSDDVYTWNRDQSDQRYAFKGEAGNWCRAYTGTWGAGGVGTFGTNLPVGAVGNMSLTVKFGRNWDNWMNRYLNFDIRVNGQTVISDSINIQNNKDGSRGHYWGFEGFGTKNYSFNVPAGATVQVVPTGNLYADFITIMMVVNN